MNEGNQVQREI